MKSLLFLCVVGALWGASGLPIPLLVLVIFVSLCVQGRLLRHIR